MPDQQRFRNEGLVLRVSTNIDPKRFDITLYEPFIDALCGPPDYQKESIRVILRYGKLHPPQADRYSNYS